jgi:hypothetical protein
LLWFSLKLKLNPFQGGSTYQGIKLACFDPYFLKVGITQMNSVVSFNARIVLLTLIK